MAGEWGDYCAAAEEIARRAGALLLDGLGRDHRVEYKGPVDLVTEVDKRSEAAIVGALAARFPDHRIVAEESGATEGASPYRWLIDPLDGTTNYAHANPYFDVALALQHGDETVVGVVYDPVRDELYRATRGGGAFLNDRPLCVSETAELIRALLSTGFPYRREARPRALAHWAAFTDAAQALRRNGAAALDLCGVAAGRFDGFYEAHLGPWDCAAGALLVAEAGGTISDYRGGPFDPFRGEVVATNGRLHDAMLRVLAETPAEP
ncbi:MAG TPA: inositol monophosphatase family protein [Thermomicrobiales bacterium]|nr:inositol monophosphatase family protein [Thermomicrobiales bacterium]